MIRALIFDFDGLIIDTEWPLIEAYRLVHLAHGVPFDEALFIRSVGHAEYTFNPWHGFARPNSASDEIKTPPTDLAALELERRAHKDRLLVIQPVLPGVITLLDAARAKNLRVGLASNSEREWVATHLARVGLLDRFEFLACRGDAAPKPAPDLYQRVLTHFGLRGREAIAFEDSNTGCLAAKRAHLHVVAVPNRCTAHHDLTPADLVLTSLADRTLDQLLAHFST
jgi:haloacid dehalogenase superfamily, subfamily IA, variant 3 with third motif having DD or ED